MCGIVGIVSAYSNGLSTSEADAFRDMLVVDSLRGFDSTGVMTVSNLGNLFMMKDALNGASFTKHSDYKDFHYEILKEGMFVFGHNRAATRGSVTDKNAHPFVIDDKICLMQNGTMRGDHKKHKDVEVDTEAAAHVIADEPDIEKALQKIDAAYAFVWYNTQDKKLHIIRNNERPLYIAYTKHKSIMFASEAPTILLAAARNNIALDKAPYLIDDDQLITFTLDDKSWEVEYKEKCDIRFRGQTSYGGWQSQWDFTRGVSNRYLFGHTEEDDTNTDIPDYPQVTPTRPNVVLIGGTESKYLLNVTIRDLIAHGACDEWMTDSLQALDEYGKTYSKLAQTNIKRVVEWTTYKPANNHPDCRVWYLFGQLVEPNGVTPKVLVYSIRYNTTEEEILKTVVDESVNYAEIHLYNAHTAQNNKLEQVWIPTVHVMNLQNVPTLEIEHAVKQ